MITKTVDVVKEFAAAIAAAVDEQGMATEDIARNIHQAATRTQAVKGIIGEVNEAAGETGRSNTAAKIAAAVFDVLGLNRPLTYGHDAPSSLEEYERRW